METISDVALGTVEKNDEDATNRQTALFSLKLIARSLALWDSKKFALVRNNVCSDGFLFSTKCFQLLGRTCRSFDKTPTLAIQANLLLLMGELVHQLAAHAIPHLPTVMSKMLGILKNEDVVTRLVTSCVLPSI